MGLLTLRKNGTDPTAVVKMDLVSHMATLFVLKSQKIAVLDSALTDAGRLHIALTYTSLPFALHRCDSP
uniref:Uncharacterized protein n=1 Tax=Parascaris equorum TaxID=6256 RepID=A0A914S2Z4_PAREQ